jgi:ubiquinone/menaquinone biosynthesis C-methylase UbiE
MVNFNSTEHWKNATNFSSFELRSHRFRDEMLPVFYQWLGISENSNVLDSGCGTGVFTRYLAKGITTGHVTGFDISQAFIDFGNEKLKELGIEHKVTLEIADGHNLHYPDNYFDAVTNYMYLSLLENQVVGMKELVRVCKTGGVVSTFGASSHSATAGGYRGNYPFKGAERLIMLLDESYNIFNAMLKKGKLSQLSEPVLFESCGLSEINIYPFSHL